MPTTITHHGTPSGSPGPAMPFQVCRYCSGSLATSPLHPPTSCSPRKVRGQESDDNQKELKELVVNGGREPSPENKDQHHPAGQQHAGGERPAQHAAENHGKSKHVDSRHQHGDDGEAESIEDVGAMVIAHAQILRNAAHAVRVVVADHEQAQENHGRDGADPVPVIRPHAILCAVGGMAHHLQRPQVRRHEGDAGDPVREGAVRQEEIRGSFHLVLEPVANPQYDDEVGDDDGEIEPTQFH